MGRVTEENRRQQMMADNNELIDCDPDLGYEDEE